MRKRVLLLGFILISGAAFGKAKEDSFRWVNIHHIQDSMLANPRPVMMFIHTDWCKYCRLMERTVFTDSTLADSFNRFCYSVKLDAGYKEDIVFLGRTFSYIKTGDGVGYHELAYFLASKNKQVSYPSTVFFSPQFELQHKEIGAIGKKKLSAVLRILLAQH